MPIKNFSQYLSEEKGEVYFTFGRMNPPTIGHGKVMDNLAKKSGKFDYKVYMSQKTGQKDPLSYKDKVKHIRKMYPKHARSVIMDPKIKNVFDVAAQLYDQGYSSVTMVVGQDRLREFDVLLNKYNGTKARHGFYKFKSIKVISAGQRDPDAEGVEGMSASKQRAFASKNDYQSFTQGVPRNYSDKDTRKLFNDVRKGMGLKEELQFKNHIELPVVSETREQYVKGALYAVGDEVVIKESEELVKVAVLGSNYVIVERTDGTRLRKWLDAVELIEKSAPQDQDIKDKEGTQPKKYYAGLKKSTKSKRDAHFKKHGKKADDDESAYKPAPGDATAKTKPSKYTKAFKDMYEGEELQDNALLKLRTLARKKEYQSALKTLQALLVRKKKENGGKLKHGSNYYAQKIAKSYQNVDYKLLHKMLPEDAVQQAKDAIERERETDKIKHDRILDRARLARARAKNRETK
jgi:hypothetical protein